MNTPFLDLRSIQIELRNKLTEAFVGVLESGHYILGGETEAFEAEFSSYCCTKFCVGVGNGLDAISLLLQAYDIGEGDEVIVPSNTFVATWLAVTSVGATPVPVEPLEDTFNLNPEAIESAITGRTRAIIPVHLYGQTADMERINAVARRWGLIVIEDAAQAQGAYYRGQRAGGLANAAATSFYPGKNLGALGDGGAILTNDAAIADKVRLLRNYGSSIKYRHELLGKNSRLDELQAAFLRVKLRVLDESNERRTTIAAQYDRDLAESGLTLPKVPEWAVPSWHLYVIRSSRRDDLQEHLRSRNIQTIVHYPIPPHRQACYADFSEHHLPIAESMAKEVLSLPMSPVLTNAQVEAVVAAIYEFTD